MTRALALGVFALSLALTGCGTTANLNFPENVMTPGPPQMRVYGGVSNDARWIRTLNETGGINPRLVAAALMLDVPLSAVADTLTLPITMWAKVDRAYASEPPPDPATANQWREFWFNDQPGQKPAEGTP